KTAATTGLTGILSKSVAGSADGYAVYLSGGNLCASFYRDATNGIDDVSGCPLRTAGFNDNQWHQIAYVVDASGARLYVDGDTQVDYGPTPAYASTTSLQAGLVTAHVQTLSGLAANALYYARVRSRDFSGNLAVSSSTTFRTAADSPGASGQRAMRKKQPKS